MNKDPKLPKLRAWDLGTQARCSSCGGVAFHTTAGDGAVFVWRGIGAKVRLGGPSGAVIEAPVTCLACSTDHDVFADLEAPPPPSQMVGY